MMRMAVVEATGAVRTVVEIEDRSSWPVPEGCRLVEDPDGKAEPGGRIAKTGFVPAPRDEVFVAGSEDNEPERDLAAEIDALKSTIEGQATKIRSLETRTLTDGIR